ncbi:MAG: TonB-dependent receptor plug domain-containing protein [Chryseolinea sp.]
MGLIRQVLTMSFLLLIIQATAQDLDSLMNLNAFTAESDLQKILNRNVAVSSKNGLTIRETPGIISLITAEEIRNSGARDMVDILRMVPGFDVMQDLQFVQGIGLRGNWANEGKVLVMMDGQPFNELLYQTVALGNRFPVDAIERIEIIRGPGSAIYGGSAEYGVINIITKAAESLNGVAVYGTGGFHSGATGRTNAGFMAANKSDDFSWDLSAFKGNGIVSDRKYQDLFQSIGIQDLSKATRADPTNINLGLKYKGLAFRGMYDQFETADPITYISNKNFHMDLQYKWKVSKRLLITPQVKYYSQIPWTYGDKESGDKTFNVRATRVLAQMEGTYDVSRKISLTAGGVYFRDEGKDLLNTNMFGGTNSLTLNNFALFAQGFLKHRLANATIGFRYEKNNRYGAAFVPRIAITKKIENFHFKVLYSQAFRAPSIQNINIALNGKIKPEKSDVFEMELGYQFTPEMLLAINAFSIVTRDALVYGSDPNAVETEWYENFKKSGTNGFEVVYSIRKKVWYANLSYSFNESIRSNTVTTYEVPGHSQYVGFGKNKFTLNANFYITPKVSINPTFVYSSRRYAYTTLDEDGNPILTKLDPYVLLNLFLNHSDFLTPGLNIGLGAYDIANQRPALPQPYNGGYAPIPGRSREFVIKLAYQLNFKKD